MFEVLKRSGGLHPGSIVKILYTDRDSMQRATPTALTNVGFGNSRLAPSVGIGDRNEGVELWLQRVDALKAFLHQFDR